MKKTLNGSLINRFLQKINSYEYNTDDIFYFREENSVSYYKREYDNYEYDKYVEADRYYDYKDVNIII